MGSAAPESPLCALAAGSAAGAAPRVQNLLAYRHRGWVGVALLAPFGVAALAGGPAFPRGSAPSLALEALGWAAFFAYAALRTWGTLYVGGRKDVELQTSGPYSLCRNPLYLGSFALVLAVAAFLESAAFACAVLGVAGLYARFVVRVEEGLLEARFGDAYRDYARRTPRFVPRLRRPDGPAVVAVDTRRLLAEAGRLSRAALFVLLLHAVASAGLV